MGITLTYPIAAPPINYELAETFSSSGARKAVRNKMFKPRFHKTSMQRLNDHVYQQVKAARQEMVAPKAKLRTSFDQFCDMYPQWTPANFAEFLLEFDSNDEDQDALLSLEDVYRALDTLGDNSSLQDRQETYHEAVSHNKHNGKMDFEDYLSFCNTLFYLPMQRNNCDYSSDEDSTIRQKYSEYYKANSKQSSKFPTQIDKSSNFLDIKPSTSSHFRVSGTSGHMPSTSGDLNETSFTDLNMVISTDSLPSSPSDPWVPMLRIHSKKNHTIDPKSSKSCIVSQKSPEGCSCLLTSSDSDEDLIIVHQGIT